jgi:hypothetical protein
MITKGFYAGVADKVASSLLPFLDRLEKINLVGIGQKFGDGIATGFNLLAGLFKDPEAVFGASVNYLKAGVLGVGNVLAAVFETSTSFFKDGLVDSFQSIGSVIVGSLTKSFGESIAFLQAGIEAAMQATQYLSDKVAGKKEDSSLAAGFSDEERGKKARELQDKASARFDQLWNEHTKGGSKGSFDKTLAGDKQFQYLQKTADQLKNYDPSKYAHAPESFQDILSRRMKEPVRFGLSGLGQTAEEWRAQGKEGSGLAKLGAAFRGMKIPDVFGAGEHLQSARAAVAGLLPKAASRFAISYGSIVDSMRQPDAALDPNRPASTNHRPETRALNLRAVSEAINNRAPSVPGSLLRTSETPFEAVGRAVSSHISSQQWATANERMAIANRGGLHRMGTTMLDENPMATGRPWTGASEAFSNGTSAAPFRNSTSLSSGGLGGGAYGKTGNIWSQISGASKKSNDPTVEHLGKILTATEKTNQIMESTWGEGKGGGGKGGGGATATN